MKPESLAKLANASKSDSLWDTLSLVLGEYDVDTRSEMAVRIMSAVVFTTVSKEIKSNTDSDVTRTLVRKITSRLNEYYPHNVTEVIDRVMNALAAERRISYDYTYDIQVASDYMDAMVRIANHERVNPGDTLNKKLGYENVERLFDAARMDSELLQRVTETAKNNGGLTRGVY